MRYRFWVSGVLGVILVKYQPAWLLERQLGIGLRAWDLESYWFSGSSSKSLNIYKPKFLHPGQIVRSLWREEVMASKALNMESVTLWEEQTWASSEMIQKTPFMD